MITYVDNIETVTPKQLEGFLAHWDFVPPLNTLLQILRGSNHILISKDSMTGEILGYIAVLSDAVSCGYISHLEVRTLHRNKGIGTELVKRMETKLETIPGIYLSCAPAMEQFYNRLGFKKITGMSKPKKKA